MSIYGIFTTSIQWKTLVLSIIWYLLSGLGITAGYHRCFSHRSYKSRWPLRLHHLIWGAAAVQGSAKWWSTGHRAHHRYTDTEKDPYNALRGFFYAHIGWLILKQDHSQIGRVSTDDLKNDPLIRFQHKHYFELVLLTSLIAPASIAFFGWNDFRGGFFFAGWLRLLITQHGTFCVNSLAHFWGTASFDNTLTPRDSIITAFLTLGEGYHNFHHEFPNDYRNAIKWYQYDPTKWFIWLCSLFGLAYDLKIFPENEIQKGRLNMMQILLNAKKERLNWGRRISSLPYTTMENVQKQISGEPGKILIIIASLVHDLTTFIPSHPGGPGLLKMYNGKDATAEFDGIVYNHTSAARNLLSQYRIARIISNKTS